jgi:hypothetical protein
MSEIKQYEYQAKITTLILCIGLFAPMGVFFANKAMTNDVGLVINGIFKLSPTGADNFYWVLCAFSTLFVLFSIAALTHRLLQKGPQYVEISETAFTIPKNLFQSEKVILFENVKNIQRQDVKGNVTLTFEAVNVKGHIANTNFKSKDEFEEATNLILQRIQASRSA